jgi:hypothetical protein
MYTKAEIFNLALGALLLNRRVDNPDTDPSNEAKVLLSHYDVAFRSTLEDLNLDSTASQVALELLEEDPNKLWKFAYKYPNDCIFLRRIQTCRRRDDRYSRIRLKTGIHDGEKVIFTDEEEAIAEYISKDIPLSTLSPTAGLCVAYKLASLSSPLITGKGADRLRQSIMESYVMYKIEAQEQDRNENLILEHEWEESEFVKARME